MKFVSTYKLLKDLISSRCGISKVSSLVNMGSPTTF